MSDPKRFCAVGFFDENGAAHDCNMREGHSGPHIFWLNDFTPYREVPQPPSGESGHMHDCEHGFDRTLCYCDTPDACMCVDPEPPSGEDTDGS